MQLTNKDYLDKLLDVIVRKLLLIDCQICFLFFDRKDMCDKRLLMYKYIIDYANKHNINYIHFNNYNVNELLRDDVHTNEKGAKILSNKIYDYFIANMMH